MAKNNNLTDFLISLANKIREKLSLNEAINPQDFENKVDEVYQAGKVKFMDDYQTLYNQDYYIATFAGHHWNEKTFKPTRNICPKGSAQYMFFFNYVQDVDTAIKNAGIRFDLSQCVNLSYLAQNYMGKILPEINTVSCNLWDASLFAYSANLTTIRKLIVKENGTQEFPSWFTSCAKLANIEFEGVIGQSIDFKSCPLTKDSILSIITHLSTTATSKTLSLKASTTNAIDWSNTVIDGVTYNTFDEICDLRTNWTISLI